MNISDEDKKYILRDFLSRISDVTDESYQRRIWINGLGPEHDSFDEFCNYFFPEGISVIENYREFWISEEQHQILVKFQEEFETFLHAPDREYLPQDFIESLAWKRVMERAKEVLKAFNYRRKSYSSLDKKRVREEILRYIEHAADKEYQQRVWIEGIGTECDSYDEFYKDFIDECITFFVLHQFYETTEEQFQILKTFHDELEIFESKRERKAPKDFIKSPEWKRVVKRAKEVLKAFNYERTKNLSSRIDNDRKQLLETFLEDIDHVSDKEYLQRVWIEGRGPECDDYDEFSDYFFNEGQFIINHYKDYGITETQHQFLKELTKELRAFDDDPNREYLPKDFIKSPEWKQVVKRAKEVLKAFNYQKKIDSQPHSNFKLDEFLTDIGHFPDAEFQGTVWTGGMGSKRGSVDKARKYILSETDSESENRKDFRLSDEPE